MRVFNLLAASNHGVRFTLLSKNQNRFMFSSETSYILEKIRGLLKTKLREKKEKQSLKLRISNLSF